MSGNRSIFVELNTSMNSNVAFGDDSKVLVNDKGKILFLQKMITTSSFPMFSMFPI